MQRIFQKTVFLLLCVLFICPYILFAQGTSRPRALYKGHESGFFSCFQVTLGLLHAYEMGRYSGVEVDFGVKGLYYDKDRGNNWWTYFFSPVCIGWKQTQFPIYVLKPATIREFGYASSILPQTRCKELIDKYIKINPEVLELVQNRISTQLQNGPYIGVQYRGTDKLRRESSYISPKQACDKVEELLIDEKWAYLPIFVATDVESFFQLMKNKFGDRVVSFQTFRSTDNKPIHVRKDISGYQKGLEALVDCLVLSKSCFLIRTSSNLSYSALLFNPDLPTYCLNKNLWHL